MIKWHKANPKDTFSKLLFGDVKKSIPMKEAFADYMEKSGLQRDRGYHAKSAYKKYAPILGDKRNINSIAVEDWDRVAKHYMGKGQRETTVMTIRTEFIRLLQWVNTGAVPVQTYARDGEKVELKISRSHIDNLIDVLPSKDSRFSDLKMEVKAELAETPKDQFAMVHLPKTMIENKKECSAARLTISKMFKDHNLDWKCIYSNQVKSLLLIRNSQWDEIKKRRGL